MPNTNPNGAAGGRIIIVTGASRGIGAALVRQLIAQGDVPVVCYRSERAAADALVAEARARGLDAIAVQADVANEADVIRLFETVDAHHGRLDALVNNAGIVAPSLRVDEMDAARIRRMFEVNVFGSFYCAREAVRRMSTRHGGRGGCIVNLSSRAASLGSPNMYVDYAASKAAIDTFTLGLALEVAEEGIRVNSVRPGMTETEIHVSAGEPGRVARLAPSIPMKRGGTADEIANAIRWLLSDEASYVTGTGLDVGGGR
ncbi:MAG: SDR family oxidoreductase [Burkholderiaceae bacterium]